MSEVIFKGAKIQTGFRVKIPKAIVDTLNLKSNDEIEIRFNPENGDIIINGKR